MAKTAKKPEPEAPKEQEFVGLLRAVSEVQEKPSSTAPKDKPNVGVFYWAELTLDTGRTYKSWSKTKPYLENLKVFIDKEVSGLISGENIRLNLPQDYMDKFPREKPTPQADTPKPQQKPLTSDQYWRNREERDVTTNAAIEQQYYISRACDFALALGRMIDGNWEEMLELGMTKGIELYHKYGRTSGQSTRVIKGEE